MRNITKGKKVTQQEEGKSKEGNTKTEERIEVRTKIPRKNRKTKEQIEERTEMRQRKDIKEHGNAREMNGQEGGAQEVTEQTSLEEMVQNKGTSMW